MSQSKRRNVLHHWTEVQRIGGAQDGKTTTCACTAAGCRSDECSMLSGNRSPCRCACHVPQPYPKSEGLTAKAAR